MSILAWLLLAISIILIVTGLRQRESRLSSASGLNRRERSEADKLQLLIDDIDDDLAWLTKVAKHRPLYPEEKYLRSKLLQYQRTITSLLKSPRSRLAKRK